MADDPQKTPANNSKRFQDYDEFYEQSKLWDPSDPQLEEKIYESIERYYKQGDRSNDIVINDPIEFGMDTPEAISYLPEFFAKKEVHDEDFSIFRIFSNPNEVILDIGANWGYSVSSIWSVGAKSKIISFEPIRAYQLALQKIKDMHHNLYDFRIMGLSDKTGSLKFVVPVVNGVAIGTLASASLPLYDQHMKILARNICQGIHEITDLKNISFKFYEFQSQVRKLDNILNDDLVIDSKIVAIKIDVEGHEYEVLKGATSTLRKFKPLVMIEGGNRIEGLSNFMEQLGYLYAERRGKELHKVDGFGLAINGFFVHIDKINEYKQAGIFSETGWQIVTRRFRALLKRASGK